MLSGLSDFDATVQALDTPDKLADWMRKNLYYRADVGVDSWNPPEKTFREGRGDCDDYARFAAYVLNKHGGYNAKLLGIQPERGEWHMTCLFREKDGTYSTMCNKGYKRHFSNRIEDVIRHFNRGNVKYKIYDASGFYLASGKVDEHQ